MSQTKPIKSIKWPHTKQPLFILKLFDYPHQISSFLPFNRQPNHKNFQNQNKTKIAHTHKYTPHLHAFYARKIKWSIKKQPDIQIARHPQIDQINFVANQHHTTASIGGTFVIMFMTVLTDRMRWIALQCQIHGTEPRRMT